MYKPITQTHNFNSPNPKTFSPKHKEPISPKRIIQNIMYTPHLSSSGTLIQSKNKNSKQPIRNVRSFYNNNNDFSPKRQILQNAVSKLSPSKRSQGYKSSKFETNQDNSQNNIQNINDNVKLVKAYSGSYNMCQLKASKALAGIISQGDKQQNNLFFSNKKASVNDALQRKQLQKLKMSYINANQPNQHTQHIQHNQPNQQTIPTNTNTNSKTQSMIYADNNNSSLKAVNKHHCNNRNNNNNNNLLLLNHYNSTENENQLNSVHLSPAENMSKKQSKNAVDIDPQGSSVCFLRTSNSDTIKVRQKFNKSKTRKKTQKMSPHHCDILNMKDVLDEIQKEEEPIKVCKTIQREIVESKEEKTENKTLILTTNNPDLNNKGFFCKCIPFCIKKNKTIK